MSFFNRFKEKKRKKSLSDAVQAKIDLFSSRSVGDSDRIFVDIHRDENEIFVTDGEHTFYFQISQDVGIGDVVGEVAMWAFLPVAMARNKELYINASCTQKSLDNARKLVEAWSCWMPKRYSLIRVHSSDVRPEATVGQKKSLLCFSGGVDSTYTLLSRDFSASGVDFITVQGMDYYISDDDAFDKAREKTAPMEGVYNSSRIFVRSNAYSVYKKYELAPRITYVFVLAACSFLYSRSYQNVILASDFALYQQMEELPYGASFATDHFFSSGDFSLLSDAEDVTRAEKLPLIAGSVEALGSLSFCKDRTVRPENCGKCIKCMRTKYMFLASLGYIPEQCFVDASMDDNKKVFLSKIAKKQDAYIKSTYAAAFWSGNLNKIPMIVDAYKKLKS